MLPALLLAAPLWAAPGPPQAPAPSITDTGTTPASLQPGRPPGGAILTPWPETLLPSKPGQSSSLYHLAVVDPAGTGYDESFLLQVPHGATASGPVPVLVAFHAYGVSEKDIEVNTTYLEECDARGWFCLAPLGASQVSFGCEPAQRNLEFVLSLLFEGWGTSIDPTRVYGVGFSMGGGEALNYAARHLDPAKPMFAAVANHTGTVSQVHSYEVDPPVQWIYEFWFGGPPAAAPFEYERASMITFDPVTEVVDQATDLARNLTHVPVRSTYVTIDPLKHLIKQTQLFHGQLIARGGTGELKALSGFGHKWSTLNETITCDWLEQHTLALPMSAETLAEADGVYFHFEVQQDAPGAFTPFTWSADAAANRLELSATANLALVGVDTQALGLDTATALEVVLTTADGLADDVELTGYAARPSAVLRDGVTTSAWTFTPRAGAVRLDETDGAAQHVWTVLP